MASAGSFCGWPRATLSLATPLVCVIPDAHLLDSTARMRRDIRAEPQTIFVFVNCAVAGLCVFYSSVYFDHSTASVLFQAQHLLGSSARIRRDIRADGFCSCELRCYRVECLLLPFSPSLIFFPL